MHLSALLTCNQESVLSFADSISWKTVRRSPLSCCFSSCFIRSFLDNFAGFAEVGLGAFTFESFEILPAISSLISLVISPSFLAGTGVQCTAGIDKCIKKHSHMQHHATSCNIMQHASAQTHCTFKYCMFTLTCKNISSYPLIINYHQLSSIVINDRDKTHVLISSFVACRMRLWTAWRCPPHTCSGHHATDLASSLAKHKFHFNIWKTGLPCTMPESKHLQNVVHSSTWVLLENCFPPAAKGLFDFNVCSRWDNNQSYEYSKVFGHGNQFLQGLSPLRFKRFV